VGGNCGKIVADLPWDPLGPGEARCAPWRTTCGCSPPPL